MIVAFLLTLLGLMGICIGMPRHYTQVFGAKPAPSIAVMTVAGWMFLAFGLLHSLTHGYWLFGLLIWIGHVLLGGLLIIFTLAFRPRSGPALALLCLPVLVISWLYG